MMVIAGSLISRCSFGRVWIGLEILGTVCACFPIKKSRRHGVLNEVYLRFFLGMGVTFRDESNDGN